MNNKEILLIVDSISNEKGMEKELIFHAIEVALETITAKRYDEDVDIRVAIDRKTGDYSTFRRWNVVDDSAADSLEEGKQILLSKARDIDDELEVGDIVEQPVESVNFDFGRIAARKALEVMMREIRLAERGVIIKRYQEQIDTLLSGVAKKVGRDFVLLDMGDGIEGVISKEEMLPREMIHIGDRVRAILYDVKSDRKGTVLQLSRTRPQMLVELFKLEVPEISEEVIEVKAVARDPGSRSKIAVKTNDGRIDPIGACVGIRGSRVQAVSNELGGEKVDIVSWDADPAQFVVNAMAPAEIISIVVDEASKGMDLVVSEDQLAQAIGRGGQNVRLASELTKWKLNVLTAAEEEKKSKEESADDINLFTRNLDVDDEVAELLVQEGFRTMENIAYAPLADLANIEGFDEEIAEALRNRARDVLLEQALTSKDTLSASAEPAKDLLEMDGMTRHLAYVLASCGIVTREDLAEQSVDELLEIKEINEDLAAKLIMTARKPWFDGK